MRTLKTEYKPQDITNNINTEYKYKTVLINNDEIYLLEIELKPQNTSTLKRKEGNFWIEIMNMNPVICTKSIDMNTVIRFYRGNIVGLFI